jgi:hypothetical protein
VDSNGVAHTRWPWRKKVSLNELGGS